jgi:hypothetical protein
MQVTRNSVVYWEAGCDFASVTTRFATSYSYNGPRLEKERSKIFEVKARCAGEGMMWNGMLYFNLSSNGKLVHESFPDNELPDEFVDKIVCAVDDKLYSLGSYRDCQHHIGLRFERDRYTIQDHNGEGIGFCRYTSVKTVWDENLVTATKSQGGHVTYITAQCPKTQKLLAIYNSKGIIYVEDKGK